MLRNLTPIARPRAACWLGCLLAFGATSLLLKAAGEPALELPKYTVKGAPDLPPPEAWRYVEFPGFTVLSNASDAKTQRLLEGFELFRHAVSIVWPLPDRTPVPVSIIVCGARNSFGDFMTPGERQGGVNVVSRLLRDRDHAAIMLDAEATTLLNAVSSGNPDEDAAGYEVEPADLICREYIRLLLARQETPLPIWMEEGMIQILLAMKVGREQIIFGKVEDPESKNPTSGIEIDANAPPPPTEDRDFNYVFKARRLMPLKDFFAITRDSPEAGRLYGDNRWIKQAYAFVHMCLFGRGGRFQKPFAAFLQRAGRGAVTEAMFTECFGMNYRQMQLELQLYIGFTDHQSREFNFKKGKELPSPTPLVMRDAEEYESARIRGDALLLGGHSALAQAVLLPAYLRGSCDPGLLATLGLCERAAGHDDRARKFLEAAVTRKVVRPEAYLELARLRHAGAVAKPAAAGAFSAEQVAGITSLLYVARHQPPHLPELYELLAETWRRSAAKPGRDDVLVLIQGATLFPQNLGLVYQVAVFAVEAGIYDAARPMIEHGIKQAADSPARVRFEQLKASLPAERKE